MLAHQKILFFILAKSAKASEKAFVYNDRKTGIMEFAMNVKAVSSAFVEKGTYFLNATLRQQNFHVFQ